MESHWQSVAVLHKMRTSTVALTQYAERILNKISKPLNETFTGSMCIHHSVEMDLSLKIEVRNQTIWKSTPGL